MEPWENSGSNLAVGKAIKAPLNHFVARGNRDHGRRPQFVRQQKMIRTTRRSSGCWFVLRHYLTGISHAGSKPASEVIARNRILAPNVKDSLGVFFQEIQHAPAESDGIDRIPLLKYWKSQDLSRREFFFQLVS